MPLNLTSEQVTNWRYALYLSIGPYAMLASSAEIKELAGKISEGIADLNADRPHRFAIYFDSGTKYILVKDGFEHREDAEAVVESTGKDRLFVIEYMESAKPVIKRKENEV